MGELVKVSAALDWLGSTDSAAVSAIILRAESCIEDLCDRPDGWLSATTHTEKFNGECSDRVILRNTPIGAMSSVSILIGSTSSSVVSSSTYRVDTVTGELRTMRGSFTSWDLGATPGRYGRNGYSRHFPEDHQNVVVVYDGGYASGSVPGCLTQAALDYTTFLWNKRQTKVDPGLQSENLGSYSYSIRSSVDSFEQSLIGPGGPLHSQVRVGPSYA